MTLTATQGGTATGTFKIAPGCTNIRVSLASYDAPAASFALPQVLIDSKTGLFNAGGPYTQTVVVSPCFFQVDLVRGDVITNLTNSNLYGDRKLAFKNGGAPCASKMTTTASAAVDVGGTISDSAILSGVSSGAGGTITFKLYGPNDATCANAAIFTSAAIAVHSSGTYGSGNFTTTAPGTYRWKAAYTGDAQNAAVSLACNATNESVYVRKKTPTLTTKASDTVTLGSPISDTATLGGTYSGTGTITFSLYGPNDATCATSISTTTKTVSGNGNYTSATFTPTAAGTYRWIASYSGDANNLAVSGLCNDTNEAVVVSPRGPSLTTRSSSDTIKFGDSVSDTAILSGASPTAGGTITFKLYGPNDATCSNAPVFTSAAIAVSGNGSYGSGSFTPTLAGLYRWTAGYSGDLNNLAIPASCNQANESFTVGPKDTTPPSCMLTATLAGPPKQLKITVQDAESGLASITVDLITNATAVTSPSPVPVGTTSPVVVTASKTDQTKSSFIRLKVTNTVGLTTICDPVVPAVKKARPAAHGGKLHIAASGFTLALDARHILYGAQRGITVSGSVPNRAAGQVVTVMSQSCKVGGASQLATVRTAKGGVYQLHVQPALNTIFSVSWNGVTRTAGVSVRPVIALTRESAGRYRVDLSTTNGVFLDGQRVELQRRAGSHWVGVTGAVLAKNSSEDAMTVKSSATLAANVYGAKLRVVLASSACYAGATSATIIG